MNQTIEIPNDPPESWPKGWTGSTRIDCGAQGSRVLTLYVSGHPNAIHVKNYDQIVARWPELWPKIYERLTTTLESPPISSPGDVLEMRLPSAPIELGPEWSISVRFYNRPGAWMVWFEGWKVNTRLPGYGYNA
jgi:hypothetical protein